MTESKIKFNRVVVVGLGLVGASLACDMRRLNLAKNIYGIDRSRKHLEFCRKKGFIATSALSQKELLRNADLVILALPVQAIVNFMMRFAKHIAPRALVVDVGSTKREIIRTADLHFPAGNFVGGHPMAGTEQAGPFSVAPHFLKNRIFFVVPAQGTQKRFLRQAQKLWQALGARVVLQKPDEHDQIMASISHLPQLLASLLSVLVLKASRRDVSASVKKGCRDFLGGGFRDMIRVASSPHEMWRDIFLQNADNMLREIRRLTKSLKRLETAFVERNARDFVGLLREGAKLRKSI